MSRKLLHENGELLTRLKRDARKVALHFGLSYRAIEAERVGEITQVQRLQALPPKVILSTAWWAKSLRSLVPYLINRSFVQQEALKRFGIFFRGDGPVRLEV